MISSNRESTWRWGLIVAIGVALFGANIRGVTHNKLWHPLMLAVVDGSVAVVLCVIATRDLAWRGQLRRLRALWAKAWPVWPYLILGLLSLTWTVDARATIVRVELLLCWTLLASYLAIRFSIDELVEIAAAGFIVLSVLSAGVGLALPGVGTQLGLPYYGAWCGIFWNRNFLGSTMALGAAVLALAAVSSWPISRPRSALYVAGWALAAALVVLSESATGAILFMVLHGALATMLIWERLRHRVTRTHYGLIAAGGVGMAAMVWTRLDTLLGLLNRNSTLTGRVGLWRFIWDAVVTRRPLLGYGLGTLWTEPSFQIAVRDAVGWRFPVVIGDNGYLDSTMQLGILGTICLILALAWAAVHSARLFMRDPRTATAAPVIALLFLLVANITLSYFLETESFIWIVTWAMVFAAARASAQFEPRRLPRRSG